MERKFPLVKVIAIGSSLALVAVLVLYRGGVIQFHRGPAGTPPPSVEKAAEPPAAGLVEMERPPEFFYGSKSGPVVVPESSNDRLIDITSKSGMIVKPEDVSTPQSNADFVTDNETP